MIISFKQHLKGTNKKKLITNQTDYSNTYSSLWHQYINKASKITGLPSESVIEAILVNCPPLETWLTFQWNEDPDTISNTCNSTILTLHHTLNKIRRQQHRRSYQKFHEIRENMREIGRLKAVINSIIGEVSKKKKNHISLDTLRNPDGSLEIVPRKIHQLITHSFNIWYQTPPTSSAIHIPPPESSLLTHATNIISDFNYFKIKAANTGVPDKYIELFTYNAAQKANSIFPPSITGYSPDAKLPYSYNLEKAKEYLKKAGYPEGKGLPTLVYDVRGTDTRKRQMGEFIQQELKKLGINVEVRLNTFPAFLEKSRNGELQFWQGGWVLDYPDSENILQLLTTNNLPPGPNSSQYSNPVYDSMFSQLKEMEDSEEKFKELSGE
jgi:hypothetical protein